MTQELSETLKERAEAAAEAIREINHLTSGGALPAPAVYWVLSNLQSMAHRMPQAFSQLSAGLGRSLDEYEVYEDDGADPVQRVAEATDHLTRAAQLAVQLGQELEAAQGAISSQAYR